MGKYTDQDLLYRLKEQDNAAFSEIYSRYWQVMVNHAYAILHDQDECVDVVQDIFLTLWNRSAELQIESSLKAYLYTATRNQALKILSRGKRKEAFASELAAQFEEGLDLTDQTLAFRELSEILEQEINNLPPRLRAIYKKSREEGRSHKEIAEEMGISENTVKSAMHRALSYLRSKLSPFLGILFFLLK